MPGRDFSSADYRFGFNGQEKVDEISGSGNHNTAMFWEYDTRLVRRWNLDPKPNPSISQYNCFAGNPIWFNDINGDTAIYFLNTQADVAQGNGHMGMAFQNVYGEWFYFSQGATGDAGSGMISGSNTSGGVDIRPIKIPETTTVTDSSGHTTTTTTMRNPTAAEVDRIVKSGAYGYTYQESTQLNTDQNQDAKIARNAFKLQRDYNSGKEKYNLYFNNCTDACQEASQNNNTGINLPIDFDPRPKEYFPKLKEYTKWFNLPAAEKKKQAEQMNNELQQNGPKF